MKRANTIEIQRFWRGYLARCLSTRLKYVNIELNNKDRMERIRKSELLSLQKKGEIDKKNCPRTLQDFAVLYNELEMWRVSEITRIKVLSIPFPFCFCLSLYIYIYMFICISISPFSFFLLLSLSLTPLFYP
jgi:hypothetical protein